MSDPLNSTLGSLGKAEIAAGGRSPIAAPPGDTSVRPPSWMVLTGILLFVGHLPLLWLYAVDLMGREPYQFAPLAVAAALFLAWHRLRLSPDPVGAASPRWALAIFAVSFSMLCLATAVWSPWLAVLSALVTALGAVWAVGGLALAMKLFPGALMLIILVRPPLDRDLQFTLGLRRIAVHLSSCLLDHLGLIHLVSGNVVEVTGHRFFVEDACSGINSVLSVGAFALFYTLWRRRRWWHVAAVWAASLSFVLLGNVIRITVAVALSHRYGIDLLSGWKHQLFGLVLFVAYLGLVASADMFLDFIAAPPEATADPPAHAPAGPGGERLTAAGPIGSADLPARQIPLAAVGVGGGHCLCGARPGANGQALGSPPAKSGPGDVRSAGRRPVCPARPDRRLEAPRPEPAQRQFARVARPSIRRSGPIRMAG